MARVMVTDADRHVGRRLRELRKLSGRSMEDLGEQIGVSLNQVGKYELGQDRVSAGRLYEIAQALGKPVEMFYEGLDG